MRWLAFSTLGVAPFAFGYDRTPSPDLITQRCGRDRFGWYGK